jgi:predicted PurR-regulated permease PerM
MENRFNAKVPKNSLPRYFTLINIASGLIILAFSLLILFVGQVVFIPIAFSVVFSILLHPLCNRLEKWKFSRVWALTTAMLLTIGALFFFVYLMGSTIANLFSEINNFSAHLKAIYARILEFVVGKFGIQEKQIIAMWHQNSDDLFKRLSGIIGNTLSSGSDFAAFFGLMLVFTFFFLLYRKSIRQIIILQFSVDNRQEVLHVIADIQLVIRNYFKGVLLVMLILGLLNTAGLLVLGIEYAPLFGFLGAVLTIFPYIGTTFGAILPFAFALVTYPDELWRAAGVAIYYSLVTQVENNFITPRVVGGKVSVNALFSFLALLIGGIFWGIGGMVLAIPLTACIKVTLYQIPKMRVYSYMLSDDFPVKDFEQY